ncbi:hypothetical protein CB0940_01233 [Cercospora beticola]|uniref:Fatty acid hydroxylase domain-containing protein n=1 Tax=Cercospora beticola TaxID=122368 RepID=A0A2G5I8L3_CERBT|nr:hypothetical protein CB0940_01233 [Cercospora beticola]PIB00834.1 hypothetical protein CB0940_01233 [Cercospora beticola]WPA96664.1 hypothetical protein RHO25_001272 [Cercospora beticola]CAK1354983.1 unnamed protein product [Cercospora beticola]
MQAVRDKLVYGSGYLSGRSAGWPTGFWELYGTVMSKVTGMLTLPLPLVSFIAIPLYGGSSTTVSLGFFYLTWISLIWSKGPLTIEIYGTAIIRLFCYLIPSLLSLGFDLSIPSMSRKVKAAGKRHLPHQLGRDRLLHVAALATCNIFLGVLLQAILEIVATRILHLRSLLQVSKAVPLPWTLLMDVLKGFAVRGAVHYAVHRYVLHEWQSVLQKWHLEYQHCTDITFSMLAAYDHPAAYLLKGFLPTFLPAVIFRWHVLTWHLFLSLVSLEEFFIFSGYTTLPSTIITGGMARRNEAHFTSVGDGYGIGNYGRLGLLDLCLGTSCPDEDDVIDDIQEEAEKHNVQDRVTNAVDSGMSKLKKQKARKRK